MKVDRCQECEGEIIEVIVCGIPTETCVNVGCPYYMKKQEEEDG